MTAHKMNDVLTGKSRRGGKTDLSGLNSNIPVNREVVQSLEKLFPGRVVIWCSKDHASWSYTSNAAAFYGLTPRAFAEMTHVDHRKLIHPEDLESFDLCCHKVAVILESEINSNDWDQYRFVIHYRVRRNNEYFHLRDERIHQPLNDEDGGHYSLMSDATDEYPFTCVQLDWYRIGPLGYTKINSYTPKNRQSVLSGREVEILKLLSEGFSSKQIADQLFISVNTVRNHRANLLRKTNSKNVVQILKVAY